MVAQRTTRVYFTNLLAMDVLLEGVTRVKLENSRVKSLIQFFHTEWAILASPLKEDERRNYISNAFQS